MPGAVLAILFGFAFTVLTCYAAGKVLLAALKIELYKEERPLFAFVCGSALLSLAIFALSAMNLLWPGVFLGIGIATIGVAAWRKLPAAKSLPALPAYWKWLFVAVFAIYTVLYWSQAMGPEYSPDGSSYHLGYVARYLRQHGFGRITTSVYASLSQGLEMLFLFAFAFGKHSSAAMVHFAFFLALTFGVVTYARRFGFPLAGIFAALLIYTSPVFGYDGTIAYNDVAAACVVFFVFYLLQIWEQERSDRMLIVAGLLSGFAYAIKYTAGIAVVYAVVFVLWKSKNWRRAVMVGAIAAILIAPWMIKNWIVVDNPFSPFMNALFPNPYVSVDFEREYVQHWTQIAGYTPLQRFLDTTYRSGPAGSILGLAFLLSPIALFGVRSVTGRRLLAATAVVGLLCAVNFQTRLMLPMVPFLALAMGVAMLRAPHAMAAIIVAEAILCWPTVVKHYADSSLRIRHFLPKQALRIESEDSTLSYRLPGYKTAKMIDKLVPANGRVFCFAGPAEAYTSRELLIYYESTFNLGIMDVLSIPSIWDRQPISRLTFKTAPQQWRAIRIVQENEAPLEQWSVAEVHISTAERTLLRSPQWKLDAKPNPFEIMSAFDDEPITRWRSHQPLSSGMRIGVDFGQPELLDTVALDTSPDQKSARLRLEGQDSSGVWKNLSTEPEKSDIAMGIDLRHEAIQELRRRSITHILIGPSFPGADDMAANPKVWGLLFLGETEQGRLYALVMQ